jgi:hypothetical protein
VSTHIYRKFSKNGIARNQAATGEPAASVGPRHNHLPGFTQLN